MSALDPIIKARREQLAQRIREIAAGQTQRINSFRTVESFLNAATREAAYGDSLSLFGHMRSAGEAIPKDFEDLDPQGTLKGTDRRVVPFIRSHQFVAMVATLEDFLSQVLAAALAAYPEKVGKLPIQVSDLLVAASLETALAKAIDARLVELFYASPLKYRQALEEYLSMPDSVLEAEWPAYVEIKARRDIGVHANWRKNELYVQKVSEAKGAVGASLFLGVNATYFSSAEALSRRLVSAIETHCSTKFG